MFIFLLKALEVTEENMKTKLTWVFFVPFFIGTVGLRIFQNVFMADDAVFLGMSRIQLGYFTVILSAVLMLVCLVLTAADRKTQAVLSSKSIVCGILSLLCAAVLSVTAASDVVGMISSASYAVLWFANAIFAVLAAFALVVRAVFFFTGRSMSRGFSVLYLMPAFWSASKLVALFSEFTGLSVRNSDVTSAVAYSFLTMFLFYQASSSVFGKRRSVMNQFVFGLPAVCALVISAVPLGEQIFISKTAAGIEPVVLFAELILFALYTLVCLIRTTADLSDEAAKAVQPVDEEAENQIDLQEFAQKVELEDCGDNGEDFVISAPKRARAEEKPEPEQKDEPQSEQEIKPQVKAVHRTSAVNKTSEFSEANKLIDKLLEDLE